jgi:hypothetical protein
VAALVSLVAALLIVRALGLFSSTGPGEPPDSVGVAAPITADVPFPGSLDAWRPPERLHPVVERRHHVFGLVCADRIGDRAILMACWRPRAELLGAYSWPPEPRGTCTFGNAYSRRPGFSVCWLDVEESLGPLEFLRLPGVRRWDLTT